MDEANTEAMNYIREHHKKDLDKKSILNPLQGGLCHK